MLCAALYAVEGELCSLEVLEVPEVMLCVLFCSRRLSRVGSVCRGVRGVGRAGGDTLCATLYAGG